VLPDTGLPKPGEKFYLPQVETHTREYAARKGEFELPAGYGKGTVTGSGLRPVDVHYSEPGKLRFSLLEGKNPQDYILVRSPKGWVIHNFSPTAEAGVRGSKGFAIPQAKPAYKEKPTTSVEFDDPRVIHQAKIDGAHVTVHIPNKDSQVRVFSYRPTEAGTGVIEHTHKLPSYHTLRAPGSLAGTVLRGEAWAAGPDGKALPAERIGGLLNAGVARSRELQQEHGPLRLSVFDVVRHKGKLMENAPYAEKLEVLRQVAKEMPQLELPPTAETPEEKLKLFTRIQEGKEPVTREGIVAWHLDRPLPTKIKFRPDVDAEVVGVFPGKGKHEGRAGGLVVKLPGSEATTRVGTGFSDQMRKELWERQHEIVGRVARVATQQVFPSGKMRAPAFKDFHTEKGKIASGRHRVEHLTTDEEKLEAAKLQEGIGFGLGPIKPLHPKWEYYGIRSDDNKLVAVSRVNKEPLKEWEGSKDYEQIARHRPDVSISATTVHPEHRRKGMAKALRAHVQDRYNTIISGTGAESDLPAMSRILEQQGFEPIWHRGANTQYVWKKQAMLEALKDELNKVAAPDISPAQEVVPDPAQDRPSLVGGIAATGGGTLLAADMRKRLLGEKVIYHGTHSDEAAKGIMEHGLQPSYGGTGAAKLTPNYVARSKGKVHVTGVKPVAMMFRSFDPETYRREGYDIGHLVRGNLPGAPGTVVKARIPMSLWDKLEIDPDMLGHTPQNELQEAMIKEIGARGAHPIESKYISGGRGSISRIPEKIVELGRELPGYVKRHPLRFGVGALGTAGGLYLAGRGIGSLRRRFSTPTEEG
jgi:GNAT superfamily N-acetyltransferase